MIFEFIVVNSLCTSRFERLLQRYYSRNCIISSMNLFAKLFNQCHLNWFYPTCHRMLFVISSKWTANRGRSSIKYDRHVASLFNFLILLFSFRSLIDGTISRKSLNRIALNTARLFRYLRAFNGSSISRRLLLLLGTVRTLDWKPLIIRKDFGPLKERGLKM